MARAPLVLAALLLLALPLMPLAVEAQGSVAFAINVVSAREMGCSPDSWTSPDLRVKVFLNDVLVLETLKAQGQDEPYFAAWTEVSATLPARIGIEVEEAEPGGFFGLGTDWVACDVAAGAGKRHVHAYEGGTDRIVATGDGSEAAQAIVVVGTDSPRAPTVSGRATSSTSGQVEWTRDASGATDSYALADAAPGRLISTFPSTVHAASLAGLCDGATASVRVIRVAEPWHVSSPDFAFTTPNDSPRAPRVLLAQQEGEGLSVRWESPTTHDVARYEVHAGGTSAFTPSDASLRHTTQMASPFGEESAYAVESRGGDAWVRVRTVDHGGLVAVSEAFQIGAPARDANGERDPCGSVTATSGSGGGQTDPVVQTPSPATPVALTPAATTPTQAPVTTTPPSVESQDAEPPRPRDPFEDFFESGLWIWVALGGLLAASLGAIVVLAFRR